MCELHVTIYTEQNAACPMLTHISSLKILRAVCILTISLTNKKQQGTLGYEIKTKQPF